MTPRSLHLARNISGDLRQYSFSLCVVLQSVSLCEPTTAVTVTATITIDGLSPTSTSMTLFVTLTGPPFTPPLPLKSFQLPITLPNGIVALGSYLQVLVDNARPDETILETQQIGPDTFFAFEFSSTHAGKTCCFYFSFSAGDVSNEYGSEDVYALTSGMVDDKVTFNNKPVSGDKPIAYFLSVDPDTGKRPELGSSSNGDFLLPTAFKSGFDCPTKPTGWEVRGAGTPKSFANWSWNHGLIIEVLDKANHWDEGLKW